LGNAGASRWLRFALHEALPRGTADAAVERKAAAFDPLNLIRLTPA
jgi:hypothetical protein